LKDRLLIQGSADAAATLVLAHGAGQGKDSDFMNDLCNRLLGRDFGLELVRFDFPYMQRAIAEGKRRPPDRQAVLEQFYTDVVNWLQNRRQRPGRVFIGGKSMGGRIATMIADRNSVDGVVALGYPFHPPGKPEKLRTAHLETIDTPVLVCQGQRDPFGNQDEVPGYDLASRVEVEWINDGEHSFKPRKSSGATLESNLDHVAALIVAFIKRS